MPSTKYEEEDDLDCLYGPQVIDILMKKSGMCDNL